MDKDNTDATSEERDDNQADVDLAASTLIGANITGANAGTYPGGIVAPAAEAAESEEAKEAEEPEEADVEEGRGA